MRTAVWFSRHQPTAEQIADAAEAKAKAVRENGKKGGRPSRFVFFREADGWHWCLRSLGYLDARGAAHPSKAAASRAAKTWLEHQA